MGPIFKGAAVVCLAALSGLQPAAGDLQFNVETADKGKHLLLGDAYTSLNLARVGHMSVRIGILTENSELAEGLKDAFTPAAYAAPANTCEGAIAELKKTKFTAKLTESGDQKYRQAVQKALEAGLKELQSYPDSEEKWREFWGNADGANLAHLLWTNSTGVGCAVGTCTEGGDQNPTAGTSIAFLFCEMKPAAVENKAPFDKEYYEALTARETPLTQMTEEDLKVPVQGSAAAAVPSLLVAGLTTIVAFASAQRS